MSPNTQRIFFQRIAKLFDLTIVAASFLGALVIASESYTVLSLAEFLSIRIQIFNLLFLIGYVLGCLVTFTSCGLYVSHRLSNWRRRVREILISVTLITGALLISRSPLDFEFATNRFLFLFWLFSVLVLITVRVFGQHLLRSMRLRGCNLRSLVIVGEGPEAAALANRIEEEPTLGYRVIQIIDARKG
jgi:FlaA1/EpsC-like NDP-sugar epimerase